jgi:hypothetical protein
LVKRNKLTFGARFGSIEVKTPRQLFKILSILEKHFISFFPTFLLKNGIIQPKINRDCYNNIIKQASFTNLIESVN